MTTQDNARFIIRKYDPRDLKTVVKLWKACGLVVPQNDPYHDIRIKTEFQPELFFVCEMSNTVVGTVMAGYEGHRGWINYLAVTLRYRRTGIGKMLVDHATKILKGLGCPKVNLQIREANREVVGFYESVGFHNDHVVSMGKRL